MVDPHPDPDPHPVTSAVVVDVAFRVEFLAGEAVGGIYASLRSGDFSPRIVFGELDPAGVAVRDDVDAAQMVVVVEALGRCPFFRCDDLVADPDVFGNRGALDLIAGEREVGGPKAAL